MKKVTIIGLNGGFGQLFSKLLMREKLELTGMDIHQQPYEENDKLQYFQADLLHLEATLIAKLRDTDCLLFCVPESILLKVYTSILKKLKPATLVVDTLSVKSKVANLGAIRSDLEILSLNPLFAPDLGFSKQNVAAVSLNPGPHSTIFIEYLNTWGASVTTLSAEAHDHLTAITQVATHFSLLCFGACLKELKYQPDQALFTPVHEILLSLLGRMVSQNAEVYWKIQTDNPYGEMARNLFIKSAKDLNEKIGAGDLKAFNTQFADIHGMTKEMIDELRQNFISYQAY